MILNGFDKDCIWYVFVEKKKEKQCYGKETSCDLHTLQRQVRRV